MGFDYTLVAATKAQALAQIDADVASTSTLPKDGSIQDAARGLMKLVSDGPLAVSVYGHTTADGHGVIQVVVRRHDEIPVPENAPKPVAPIHQVTPV